MTERPHFPFHSLSACKHIKCASQYCIVYKVVRLCFPLMLQRLPDATSSFCESEVKSLSRVQLFVTPWTVDHQAPASMGFSRPESWSGLPFPSPGESSRPRDQTLVSRITGRRFNL